MATKKQSPIPTSIESLLNDIDDYDEVNTPEPKAAIDLTVNDEPDNIRLEASQPCVAKAAGRKKQGGASETVSEFSVVFEKCLQEFGTKAGYRQAPRVSIDYDIAETLRLIKGYELRAIVNASLKAMLQQHKDELKNYMAPKPKFIV